MLENLLIGLATMAVCLILQAILLVVALRFYTRHQISSESPSALSALLILLSVMILLVIGNLAQLFIWALLFQMLGEFNTLSDAFYHSAVNFSTLGYGDLVMSERHRLLGPLEAINGVLMIGFSTAALITTFQDSIEKIRSQRRNNTTD
jgi:hypothetical protein